MHGAAGPRSAKAERTRIREATVGVGLVSGGVLSGACLGALVAVLAVLVGAAGASSPSGEPQAVLDATHLPPLLRLAGEPVELRYDVHCAPAGEQKIEAPCDATGSAFISVTEIGPYRELPLRLDPAAIEGRYVAVVPPEIAERSTGFVYYAVFRSGAAGRALTLPAGGSAAPQQSLPLLRPVEVELGRHVFGDVRRADARVAEAAWGDGPEEIGLEQGRNLAPIGGSSFDVGPDGTVHLLDQVHRRILRWSPGSVTPGALNVQIDGRLADLAVGDDGSYHVLELAAAERKPLLRTFDPAGRATATAEIAERTASQVRLAGDRPLVLQEPSGQWMPLEIGGLPLTPGAQKASGRAGRLVPGEGEILVLRTGKEIRVAVVGRGGMRQAWRITSETPVAEVQVAEPAAGRFVVVARLYTDTGDEFEVLVLGAGGVVQRFATSSVAWAETAPLSRFRLRGTSLYELGSTPAGLFVDRFDLEVN